MPTILIADDSMFQRFMHTKTAKGLGLEVMEAKDGRECLELLRSARPDLLLLDLNMPGLSGMEVLQALKQEAIPVQVLVITADIQDTTRKRCIELGVSGFVTKPVDEEQLKAQLAALAG